MEPEISRFILDKDRAVLLVVDVQEKLIPTLPEKAYRRTLKGIRFLLKGARLLDIPVVATEQYPKGLGHTTRELGAIQPDRMIEKVSFSCCGEPAFLEFLEERGRSQVILTGMEAHVCVYQTALGLLERGFQVHVVREAVISQNKRNARNALELAAQAGAIVTTAETALFQMVKTSVAPEFKGLSQLVKEFRENP